MDCPTCGQVVPAGTHICPNCGAEVLGEDDHPVVSEPRTIVDTGPVPYLVIAAGPGRGQTFDLHGEVRLGRSRSNAIVLSDGKVSRNHARLDPVRDTYILTDLGSANGTLVNGVRITQPVRLRDGDLINVGDTQLLFHTGPPAHPPRAGRAMVSPQPAPVPAVSPSPPPASLPLPVSDGGKLPTWVWFGCAALVIVTLLLIIVALTTGILIGQGLGGM